jgi:Resolvase, N terminal domain
MSKRANRSDGRRSRRVRATEPEAREINAASIVKELVARFGPPTRSFTKKGSQFFSWILNDDPRADGMIVIRMSTFDDRKGATAMAQLAPITEMLDNHGLGSHVRELLVTINNSGARPFSDRIDFARIIEVLLHEGPLTWVAYRDIDRLSRDVNSAESIQQLFQVCGVELWLSQFNRAVDWYADKVHTRILALIAEVERDNLHRRSHGAIFDRYLRPGRGAPNMERKFGLARDEEDWLIPCPRQWPLMRPLFDSVIAGGAQAACEMLEAAGETVSKDHVLDVVRSRWPVTGEIAFEYMDEVFQAHVELSDPIPEHIWERANNRIDVTRGAAKRKSLGEFPFNGIRLYHRDCAGQRDSHGELVLLYGRYHRDQSIGYRHTGRPDGRGDRSSCKDFVAHDYEIEPVLCSILRQQAAAQPAGYVFTDEQRAELDGYIADVDRAIQTGLQDDAETRRGVPTPFDRAQFAHLHEHLLIRSRHLYQRRATLDALSEMPVLSRSTYFPKDDLIEGFNAIVTDTTPVDSDAAIRRQLVIEACVEEAEIWEEADGWHATLRGPWQSDATAGMIPIYPLQAARPLIEGFLKDKMAGRVGGWREEAAATAASASQVQTDEQGYARSSVCTLPSRSFLQRFKPRRAHKTHQSKPRGRPPVPRAGRPSWEASD